MQQRSGLGFQLELDHTPASSVVSCSVQVDIQQGKYSGRTPAFFSGIYDIYSWERGRLERNQWLWMNPVWFN